MDSLVWLASCLEQGRTAIVPALVPPGQRKRLETLRQMGALTQVRARAVICPLYEAHGVEVIAADKAMCEDCGPVELTTEHLRRLTPDGDWLRRRMAQALGLSDEPAWALVPERVWRLGDIGRAGQRRRVLFGQRLGDVSAQRTLLSLWPTHIGEIPTILVTTTEIERVYLPGVPANLIPLPAAFRIHGTGLVADEAVWAGIRTPVVEQTFYARHGPFSHDYVEVLLPDETVPVSLTRTQTEILRILWELDGVSIDRETLMQKAGIALEKPVDAFPRNKYPDANRAYRALVSSDGRGRYRMSRNQSDPALP